MHKIALVLPALGLSAFLAVCLTVAVHAQNTPPSPAAAQAQPAPPTKATTAPNPDDQWLAGVAKHYYSAAKDGLDAFDCAVHPDWDTLFVSAQESSTAANDPRVALLNTVKIALHGRMKGGSTLDWIPVSNPDKPLDADSVHMLEHMREATEETLEGFMQFWTPFVDGSIVPGSSVGLEITHSATGHTVHGVQKGAEVTEVFDNGEILQQYHVKMSGTLISFVPAYQPTGKGLLVNHFLVHIQPAGAPAEQTQEMRLAIEYQTVGGFPIPARLSMEVVNTGTFNFRLDSCVANPPPK